MKTADQGVTTRLNTPVSSPCKGCEDRGCLSVTKTIQLEISGINMKQLNAMLRETESL